MIISVTRQHIKRSGKRAWNCPVASALKDAGIQAPYVNEDQIIYVARSNRSRFTRRKTPRSAARFIKRFDRGAPVRPFRFRLPATVHPT